MKKINLQEIQGQVPSDRFDLMHLMRLKLFSLAGLFATFRNLTARWRRWKRACLTILLGIFFLCVALCVLAFFLLGRATAQEAEPLPLDVLLLIDHSNSMWGKDGTGSDPNLLRVRAANLFIAYLAADPARSGSRLGVVHFGGESELVVPLTSIDSQARRQAVRAAIADPHPIDWTDPLGALGLAHDTLFSEGRQDLIRRPVVILLTDGKPELPPTRSDGGGASYVADLRALVGRFREQECPIFTVALSSEAADADLEIQTIYRNLWQEIAAHTPPASYHEAHTADDLLSIYHAIVATLTGARAEAPIVETSVEGETDASIAVEEGLARVTLVILHTDPDLDIRLLRPGGAQARPDDPDVRRTGEPTDGVSLWSIVSPRPGHWTLSMRGQGSVLAWQDKVTQPENRSAAYILEAIELPTYVVADQPLVVDVFVREDGSEEEVVSSPDLQITAEVRRAGFPETVTVAHDDGRDCDAVANDGYHCLALSDLPPGACTLLLRALLDGVEIAQRERAFEVLPPPSPSPAPQRPMMPLPALAAAAPSHTARVHPLSWIAPLVAVGALGGIGGWLIRRRRRPPTLDGHLRVLSSPSGQSAGGMIDLPARSSVLLGGAREESVSLPGEPCRGKLRAERTPEGAVEQWIEPVDGEHSEAMTLNDQPIDRARRLRDGDVLTVGEHRLRYENLRQAGLRRAWHRPRHKKSWTGGTR